MHLEVKSACVADGVSLLVTSPQRSDIRLTVSARCACSPSRRLQPNTIHPYNIISRPPEGHSESVNQRYVIFPLFSPGGSTIFGGALPYLAMVKNPSILSWIQMLIWITTKI